VAQQSPTTSPHVFGLSARLRAFSSGYRVASMTIRQSDHQKARSRPLRARPCRPSALTRAGSRVHHFTQGFLSDTGSRRVHDFTAPHGLPSRADCAATGGVGRTTSRGDCTPAPLKKASRAQVASHGFVRLAEGPWTARNHCRSDGRRPLSQTTLTPFPILGSHSTLSPSGSRAVNSNTDSTGLICGVYRDGRRW